MAAREAEESISWGKAYRPDDESASRGNFVTPGIHVISRIEDTSYQKSVILCPDIAVYKFDNLASGIKEIVNHTHASFAVSFSEKNQFSTSMRVACKTKIFFTTSDHRSRTLPPTCWKIC